MVKIPGRPAYPRSASLAPRHTLPRLRSRSKVTSSSAFESRIGRRFDRMDRKACTRIKGTTIQRKAMSESAIHLPGRSQASTCNVSAMEGRGEPEGGWPASPRPAGLACASVATTQLSPTSGEDLKRPGEGSGHVATPLGRPAPHVGL